MTDETGSVVLCRAHARSKAKRSRHAVFWDLDYIFTNGNGSALRICLPLFFPPHLQFYYVVATTGAWGPGPLHGHMGIYLHQIVHEFQVGRFGEHTLSPEAEGQVAVQVLEMASKVALVKLSKAAVHP